MIVFLYRLGAHLMYNLHSPIENIRPMVSFLVDVYKIFNIAGYLPYLDYE